MAAASLSGKEAATVSHCFAASLLPLMARRPLQCVRVRSLVVSPSIVSPPSDNEGQCSPPENPDAVIAYLPLLQLCRHRRHFSAFMNYFVVFGASWCGGVVEGVALISGRGGNIEGGEGGV